MKITVDIDCTPAEARQFFGQPDFQPMQERLIADLETRLRTAMQNGSAEAVANQWMSMWGVKPPKKD
jgi:hypothetical protein